MKLKLKSRFKNEFEVVLGSKHCLTVFANIGDRQIEVQVRGNGTVEVVDVHLNECIVMRNGVNEFEEN